MSTKQTNNLNCNGHKNCSHICLKLSEMKRAVRLNDLTSVLCIYVARLGERYRRDVNVACLPVEWPRGKGKAVLLHAMLAYEGVEGRSTHS